MPLRSLDLRARGHRGGRGLAFLSRPPAARPPNLLLDPSFEDIDVAQWRARTRAAIEKSNDRARHGARSLKVTSTGTGSFDVDTNNLLTPAGPGEVYTFLASIYPTVARQFLVAVEWLRADRTVITGLTGYNYLSGTAASGAWFELARTFPASPPETAFCRFVLRSNAGALDEVFYADQISFRQGTSTVWEAS